MKKYAKFTPHEYFMGRDKTHISELTPEIYNNVDDLLDKVNALLRDLEWPSPVYVSSGWRPAAVNASIPNSAKKSHHMIGKAIDIKDPKGELARAILNRPELLTKHSLWIEDPNFTKGWVHLDTGTRSKRPIQIFKP